MFNLLKLNYHNKNIFTYDSLTSVLNENSFVDVFQMKPSNFHDHKDWQDGYYRTPTSGEFKQTHIFKIRNCFRGGTPTVLMKQDDLEAAVRLDDLQPTEKSRKAKKMTSSQRSIEIAQMEKNLKVLKPPGMKPIKEVELYTKWRPLLPKECQDDTCPKPSEEVMTKIKNDRCAKAHKRSMMRKKIKLTKNQKGKDKV